MSGGGRGIDFKNENDVRGLIAELESQGARVQWSGSGRGNGGASNSVGNFPAKVYPPDPTKHFILFHGSQSDSNAATLKRNQVKRAGLRWPGDKQHKNSRKETPMTAEPAPTPALKPLTHQRIPSGVANRKHPPLVESVQLALPVAEAMPATFWTDTFLDAMRGTGKPGYRGSSGMQRAQDMLDWLGYRVVESKRNRNGYSYRWVHDPLAVVGQAVTRSEAVAKGIAKGTVTPIKPVAPTPKKGTFGEPKVEFSDTPSTLAANAGPIAEAMAEAERKKAEKVAKQPVAPKVTPLGLEHQQGNETIKEAMERHTKYGRKQCADCERWFTEDGLARHQESTGHGEEKPVAVTPGVTEVEPNDGTGITKAEREFEPEVIHELTDDGPQDVVPKADYDTLEQMAQETEAKLHAANQAKAQLLETVNEMAGEVNALKGTIDRQTASIAEQEHALQNAQDSARHFKERAENAERAVVRQVDDGSWVIDPVSVQYKNVSSLIEDAGNYGVTIEIRGKHA